MKRKILIITLLLAALPLSSCFYYAPSYVKYNDVKYKTGWYAYGGKSKKDYFICGIPPMHEEPLFTKNRYQFWSTTEFTFEFLYGEFDESLVWGPKVYVAEDKYEEAKTYYHDKSNFDYYIGTRFGEEVEIPITDTGEIAVVDYAIESIMEGIKTEKVKTKDDMDIHNLTCFRRSKDGLLMTYKEELVIYKETVYGLGVVNGADNTWVLHDLKENGKALYQIFAKNNLI